MFKKSPVRFYKYYFVNSEKPLIMEANNRGEADKMLVKLADMSNGKINLSMVNDVRVETPIWGVSKTKMAGKEYVWVGLEMSEKGWLEKEEFNKLKNK